MNYYEHHLGDYDGATAHLSWLEDCAYRRLLCLYYRNEKPIPADIKQACRLVRATSKQERAAVQQVLEEFFCLQVDGWHHGRCDAEIAKVREKSEKARASVAKRWENRSTDSMPSDNERNTNVSTNVSRSNDSRNTPRARPQSPVTSNQTPVTSSTGVGGTPQPQHATTENPPPPVPIRTIGDWNPKPAVVDALCSRLHSVPRQFVDEQILEFRTYWGDRGGSADSWDAKFLQRCSGEWKRNGHTWRAAPKPIETGSAFDRLQDRSWAAGLELSDESNPDDTPRLSAGGDA